MAAAGVYWRSVLCLPGELRIMFWGGIEGCWFTQSLFLRDTNGVMHVCGQCRRLRRSAAAVPGTAQRCSGAAVEVCVADVWSDMHQGMLRLQDYCMAR